MFGAVELILGLKHDNQLGPSILLGMGGIAAELYKDTAVRLAPLSRKDAEEMIGELKSAPLLSGFRGRPVADVEALIDAMLAFSSMVSSIGTEPAGSGDQSLVCLAAGRRREGGGRRRGGSAGQGRDRRLKPGETGCCGAQCALKRTARH